MTEGALIREAVREDFGRWLGLWEAYNAFYGRTGPTALPAHTTQTTWARFFDPQEPMHALVAELKGEVVGLAHYLFHRSTTSAAPVCYLRDLYTSPTVRGRGVATQMIDRVCAEARGAGSPDIYWQTHESNHVARRLYDALARRSGFIVYQKPVRGPSSPERRSLMLSLLGAVALSGSPARAEPAVDDRASLIAFADAFDRAQLAQDASALDRMTADDLVFIDGSGVRRDKQAFIAGWTAPGDRYDPITLVDRTIIPLGNDAGVVGADVTLSGVSGGSPFSSRFRFADTFERTNGVWRAVHIQVTRVA